MVSKNKAFEIAKKKAGQGQDVEIFDEKDFYFNVYLPSRQDEMWVAVISDKLNDSVIQSSEIILISKTGGKILYHGSANDEG